VATVLSRRVLSRIGLVSSLTNSNFLFSYLYSLVCNGVKLCAKFRSTYSSRSTFRTAATIVASAKEPDWFHRMLWVDKLEGTKVVVGAQVGYLVSVVSTSSEKGKECHKVVEMFVLT
jgi:hypothetical protein